MGNYSLLLVVNKEEFGEGGGETISSLAKKGKGEIFTIERYHIN